MQENTQQFVSQFPEAFREHIPLKDEKFSGAYRLAPLSAETRDRVINALMEVGDYSINQISVSAAQHISTIKENLLEAQSEEVKKFLNGILSERMGVLRKEEDRQHDIQIADTPDYEKSLRERGQVTLAQRKSEFTFSSWETVNIAVHPSSYVVRDQLGFEKYFNFDNRPWVNRELLEKSPDEVFDTSSISMRQAMRQNNSAVWSLPVCKIRLTHETYGPYLHDYYTALLGYPGVLEPLDGISFKNQADQKVWDDKRDPKIFWKREADLSLELDISKIPELSHIFQKRYSISFEYYDNHYAGW